MCLAEIPCEAIRFWNFLGNFSITDAISVLVINMFRLFSSFLFSLGRSLLYFFFPRNSSISSRLSNLLVYKYAENSRFCISVILVVVSLFSFLILLIWTLFFS